MFRSRRPYGVPLARHPVTPSIPVSDTDIGVVVDRAGNVSLFLPTDRGPRHPTQEMLIKVTEHLNKNGMPGR